MTDVVIRPWKKEDAEQLASIADNRAVWLNVRDRFPHPYTLDDAVQWLELNSKQEVIQNFCIEYKEKVAGSVGVIRKDDVYRKTIEIGYFVGEPFWGKGVATGAVAQMLQYIHKTFDVVRIYAEVFGHNKASMSVLRKNGFYLESIRKRSVYKDGKIMDDYVWVKLL